MLTVAIDHQIFTMQRVGGISRQFTELIREARTASDIRIVLPFLCTRNLYLKQSGAFSRQRWLGRVGLPRTDEQMARINRAARRRWLRLRSVDVYHPTYYDATFVDDLGDVPFVLTVVDMIPELFPDLWPDSPHWDKAALIPRAAAILTISETTRRDLLRLHTIPPERIFVTPLGAPTPGPPRAPAPALPDTYVLYVGDRHLYKNFQRLLEALAPLMQTRPDLHLVCAGGGPFTPAETRRLHEMAYRARVHAVSPDDEALGWMYRRATCVVYPSWYEGFGLPILEAFAFGCPVACSTADSFLEVAGDAALFFDPHDTNAVTAALDRLLGDDALRARLTARGTERVRDFSWHRHTQQTLAVYRIVADR